MARGRWMQERMARAVVATAATNRSGEDDGLRLVVGAMALGLLVAAFL